MQLAEKAGKKSSYSARPGARYAHAYIWARFRGGRCHSFGGQSVPPDGIHLPPELSTCHGPGLRVLVHSVQGGVILSVARACRLMASTYRRSFPPATGPACVSWFIYPGRCHSFGGQSVPPDGVHLPPELSTCHGGGLLVLVRSSRACAHVAGNAGKMRFLYLIAFQGIIKSCGKPCGELRGTCG